MRLASSNRLAENVGIGAIVIAKLEFRDIQREIFGADFVERPDHAALHEAPEAFDCLRVDRSDHVLAFAVVHDPVREFTVQMLVANPFIRANEADFGGHALANESFEGSGANICDDASHYVAFALHRASNDSFARATRSVRAVEAVVLMTVICLPADKRLIDLDNAHELAEFLVHERGANAVAHAPSGPVGAGPDHPMDLQGANPLLAGEHQMDHAEPLAERVLRVLKDRADQYRKTVGRALHRTGVALPIEGARSMLADFGIATARAHNARRPAASDQIGPASIFTREGRFPLTVRHLMDALAVLFHCPNPLQFLNTNIGRFA
jgi:hypothetical protein